MAKLVLRKPEVFLPLLSLDKIGERSDATGVSSMPNNNSSLDADAAYVFE